MQTKSKNVLSNFLWRFFERIGAQGVKLLVELLLARLLSPEDYGLIALITVIITLLNVFVDSGLGNALIQKKNADDLDFSSVFWFNIILCVTLYIFLFLTSPLIAAFYEKQELIPVIRVLGLQIIISGVKNVQQAYVSRTMQFKKFFFSTLGGTIGAAVIGIIMAKNGYGVWALVAQQLFNTFVDTAILWITVKWKPQFKFSATRLYRLFSFGSKIFLSSLIDTVYTEIRQLIIGKMYSSSDLAFFNRGQQFPALFVGNINTAIDSVLFPTLSSVQDNRDTVKTMTRRSIQVSVFFMAPLMMGLAFTADNMIELILTSKWIGCVEYLRIFCFSFLFYPIHTANLNAVKAMGRSDMFLKMEIAKKTVGVIVLLLTMNISVRAMAYSLLATSVINQTINSWPNKKLLNYSYYDQFKDILPSIILSITMGALIYMLNYTHFNKLVILLLQMFLGVILYLFGASFFKIEPYLYCKNFLKGERSAGK